MTPAQTVKEFCKRNNIKVCNKHKTIMLSKKFPNGAMWIEVFENYTEALTFIVDCQNKFEIGKIQDKHWDLPNYR